MPLSARGAGFLFLASALLLEGLLRSELGALLCGAGLGLAILLSLFGVLVEGRRQSRALSADPDALRFRLSAPVRDENGKLKSRLFVHNKGVPVPGSPGVLAWVGILLETGKGRTAEASVLLPGPGSDTETGVPGRGKLLRGIYRGGVDLMAGDVFGFCIVRHRVALGLETAALPEETGAVELYPRGAGGERPDLSDRLVRGEDRFDSRPYLPGDDTRRINWKQYARFGDLFVRPGDLSPPPRKALRVLLDTERPRYMEGKAAETYLDALVSAALGYIQRMKDYGLRVQCSAPGVPDAPEKAEGLARWLAERSWETAPGEIQTWGPEPLAVFGAPGSLGRRRALEQRKAKGRETFLILMDLPPRVRRPWTSLFLLSVVPQDASLPGRAFRSAFGAALERDVREVGGAGGVDVHIL